MSDIDTRGERGAEINMMQQSGTTAVSGHAARRARRAVVVGAALAAWVAGNVWGQNYGHDFVTVGAPGNAAATPAGLPFYTPGDPLPQSVGYEFRITRTEVLTSQWFEFVQAYRPYYTGFPNDISFTGWTISRTFDNLNYSINPGQEQWPIEPSWEMAARYCNWLHNGKVNEAWAFENGAYDTSTFIVNPEFLTQHQRQHNPDARFWIPTYDELMKATYYDPNRYGTGQEGYWTYPNMRIAQNIPGPPGIGTTNATLWPNFLEFGSAGSYPDQVSPWGLLDTSGGSREMTETAIGAVGRRFALGAAFAQSQFNFLTERFEWSPHTAHVLDGGFYGFRVASSIPSPSAVVLLGLFGFSITSRRRV